MKNIPIVTVLIWTAFLLGFWLQPGVFRLDVVQLPAAIILSILLPVSFWQLKKRGKKYHAFIFIGILLFNVSFLLLSVQSNYSAQQALFKKINKGLRPEFAAYVETAASGNKRRLAAQIIYRRHGIALPYKNDAGSYMLYTPDKSDKEKHKENFFTVNDLKLRSMTVFFSLQIAVFLLIIHAVLFTGMLVFLILYDKDA